MTTPGDGVRGNVVFVVQGELALLVSSMRRNTRWAPQQHDEQDPLLQEFGQLKQRLAGVTDVKTVDVNELIMPFLSVIRSDVMTGPITGVALSSVHKFLSYGIVHPSSLGASSAIESIANAVAHVHFVSTDWASDEVVLMKMLQVARTLLCCSAGKLCSNEGVVELVQACMRVCFERVLSELLRRTAEHCLADMIQVLFSRILDVSEGDDASAAVTALVLGPPQRRSESSSAPRSRVESVSDAPVVVVAVPASGVPKSSTTTTAAASASTTASTTTTTTLSSSPSTTPTPGTVTAADSTSTIAEDRPRSLIPYGAPCIREILRFLVAMINKRTNTDHVVTLGLSLLTVALETAGESVGRFTSVMELVEDALCRNLFTLLRADNPALVASAFRLCFLVFAALRLRLKFQLSHFINILRTLEFPSYEHREAALDCVLQLTRLPGFWADLYINYDCHLFCQDQCSTLLTILGQHAFPEEHRLLSVHVTALDTLLAFPQEIASRDNTAAAASRDVTVALPKGIPAPGTLGDVRARKQLLLEGMNVFNENPKKGLQFLLEKGLLTSLGPAEVASFLRSDPRLDKAKIGEYIGGPKHIDVLNAFVTSFDFRAASIDEALRTFLTTFRLPGEAQIIQRILESFGNHWFATYSGARVIANADTAFVMAYAVIILNVDLHNPKNKNRMTIKDFVRNHRGLNASQDFPQEFLERIYNSIKSREIVMPEEQTGDLRDTYEWQVMLTRGRDPATGTMVPCAGIAAYDRDVFLQMWRPTLTSLTAVFDAARDDAVLSKVLNGLRVCAGIAARFALTEVVDSIIIALSRRVFVTADGSIRAPEDAIAIPFGRSTSARAAAVVMFELARQHGDYLRDGWKNLLQCVLQMYTARLLPESLVTAEDLLAPGSTISLMPAVRETVTRNDSIFSAISSFLLSNDANDRRETSADDAAARDVALACVVECNIPGMFEDSKFLHIDALTELCKSLASLSQAASPSTMMGSPPPTDHSAVLFLELLCSVTLWNQDRVSLLWQTTYNHLVELVTGVSEPTLLVRRAVVGLLRLAQRLLRKEDVADQVIASVNVLHTLQPPVHAAVAEHMSAGVLALVRENIAHIERCRGWPAVLGLAGRCRTTRRCVRNGLECATLVVDAPDCHTPAAFIPLLAMLRDMTPALTLVVGAGGGNVGNVGGGGGKTFGAGQNGKNKSVSLSSLPSMSGTMNTSSGVAAGTGASLSGSIPNNLVNSTGGGGGVGSSGGAGGSSGSGGVGGNGGGVGGAGSGVEHDGLEEQLLDLLFLLHTRASSTAAAGELDAWQDCWQPLLQTITAFCADSRRIVRQHALTVLQRALLLSDMEQLSGVEWRQCLDTVIFPLLTRLLESPAPGDTVAMEETRMRACTLLCKVFLQHLNSLLGLDDFGALWLHLLDFMDLYMHADNSELLMEAVPESLKNMLLVMSTAGIFKPEPTSDPGSLWTITWTRIGHFLPTLHRELFPADTRAAAATATVVVPVTSTTPPPPSSLPQHMQQGPQSSSAPASMPCTPSRGGVSAAVGGAGGGVGVVGDAAVLPMENTSGANASSTTSASNNQNSNNNNNSSGGAVTLHPHPIIV